MRIKDDLKLDFSDVLLEPKRSTLESRSEVSLIKEFKPKYGQRFKGVPIIASNMATGTFDMLNELKKHDMFTAIAKHNNHLWKENYLKDPTIITHGFYTLGINDSELVDLYEFKRLVSKTSAEAAKQNVIYPANDQLKIIVDVANGYTQKFAKHISLIRESL